MRFKKKELKELKISSLLELLKLLYIKRFACLNNIFRYKINLKRKVVKLSFNFSSKGRFRYAGKHCDLEHKITSNVKFLSTIFVLLEFSFFFHPYFFLKPHNIRDDSKFSETRVHQPKSGNWKISTLLCTFSLIDNRYFVSHTLSKPMFNFKMNCTNYIIQN